MKYQNNLQSVKLGVSRIYSRIARLIRPHKTIAIGFATSLILSQLCGSCTNTSKSEYFVKTVGSCHRQTSIKIIDESNGIVSAGRFTSTSQDSHFNNYVNTISKYVFAKIDEMGQCRGNWQDDPQVQLVFVYRPLISQGIAPFNFEQTKSDKTQYLDSPWVKLTIDRSPKPMVRAAFIWNERQFLLDQALLSGARTDPIKPLLPIDSHVFNKFVDDYEEAVVMAPRREAAAEKAKLAVQVNISKRFKEVKAAAQVNISSRLPADIMWLLDHTALVSDPPTRPGWTMDNVIKQRSETYVNLTKALLDSRFASEQSNRSYQSFLDLKDIFNIDKYRINSLH